MMRSPTRNTRTYVPYGPLVGFHQGVWGLHQQLETARW